MFILSILFINNCFVSSVCLKLNGILRFSLIEAHGKKNRGVTEQQDVEITNFLKTCTFKTTEIRIGRLEIEEFMIQKHQPILNKKSK